MKQFSSIAWLTVFSLSIGLIFLWFSIILGFTSRNLSDGKIFKHPILVELIDDYSEDGKSEVLETLKSSNEIDINTISIINEIDAYAEMSKEFNSVDSVLSMNPFSEIISFRWENSAVSDIQKEKILELLKANESVSGVFTEEVNLDGIKANLSRFGLISLVALFFLSLFSIALLYNVIRLFLLKDEKKVKTMLLVGAEEKFILRPYIKSSLSIGLMSFLISTVIVLLIWFSTMMIYDGSEMILSTWNIIFSSLIVLIIALLLPAISTYFIIRLYLRKL